MSAICSPIVGDVIGLRQEAKTRALLVPSAAPGCLDGGEEIPPAADFGAVSGPSASDPGRRGQDRGLREDVGGPDAGWMLWIAFDFGRMTLVALHQHRRGDRRQTERPSRRTADGPGPGSRAGGRTGRSFRPAACVQALTPASASDALISFRNSRRPLGSFHCEACSGNSRCR